MITLSEGRRYTRIEIAEAVGGGDLRSYLPYKDGRILAACLARRDNPRAPRVILAGSGPGQKKCADILCGQSIPVPNFVKKATNEWEYRGRFRVVKCSEDPEVIRRHRAEVRPPRPDVCKVIFLQSIG